MKNKIKNILLKIKNNYDSTLDINNKSPEERFLTYRLISNIYNIIRRLTIFSIILIMILIIFLYNYFDINLASYLLTFLCLLVCGLFFIDSSIRIILWFITRKSVKDLFIKNFKK